jgi:predicted MPP superfamily phosphohydrolase
MKIIDWAEIDRLRNSLATPRLQVQQAEDDEVKLIEYDFNDRKRFPKPPSQVELTHLTDLQYGSKGFLQDRFLEYREWILASPNRFVVLGGDLIDAATVLSVGSPHDNTGEPIDQVDGVSELLAPLAARGRILGYVGGNHERRTVKTYGDCGRTIARNLQVPYSRGVQLIDIRFGKHQPFKLSLWHGSGSARTKGAKAQMIHRFMQQADSHVYLVGHLHDVVLLFDWRQQRVGGRIKLQKIAGIMSSSFLGYWNSYAEVGAMSPSDTMMARILIKREGGWEVTLT